MAKASDQSSGGGILSVILALLITTGLAVGAGGLFGLQFAQREAAQKPGKGEAQSKEAPAPPTKEGGKEGQARAAGPRLVPLPNIVTNLAAPDKTWIRLEASVVVDADSVDSLPKVLTEDLLAFLRTVKLDDIQGASGYQYLREDLNERVRVRGQGKIKDFILQSIIVE